VFSVGSIPKLYNEDPRLAEIELRESLESAVENDGEEMARKELGCTKKPSCVPQLQRDWYNYYVEIRYQDTTRED
jgi:hypothetical protein